MGKKVLIIEDNNLNMKLIRTLLQVNSLETIEAENAEKGIRLAQELKPNLILMDIQLPGMDGLQATKKNYRRPEPYGYTHCCPHFVCYAGG